ncbi:hypothetical protein B9Z55_003681 [Caenorhabditis nigoni]|uniref:F-box domain-containing protein n=1 Tax=Caenorhabditis nigoni TaxID=1611254 RepID=A0A2G5VRW1_9PELO|nr:hypothetical protein B9Z55_003681 [Caenorhabditis nigoni]
MPIALLKFPTDLLRDVFKLCDPFQLYALSKCSKKTQKSIKSGGTRNWKLQFCGGNLMVASVDGLRYNFGKTENPDDYFMTKNVAGYGNYMSIQIGDPFDEFFYLIDTFRIRVLDSLGIYFGNVDKFSNAARELIERHIEVEDVHIEDTSEVKDIDKLMTLINKMNITQKFVCLKKFPSKFRHHFDKFPKMILMHYSFWFDISQLLECTCVRIELQESLLSNQDINVFFGKWKKSGTFPNLRFLKIVSKKITNKSPILEMIPPIENDGNQRTRISFGAELIDNPVHVINDDGTVGLLTVELANWSTLKFLVLDEYLNPQS